MFCYIYIPDLVNVRDRFLAQWLLKVRKTRCETEIQVSHTNEISGNPNAQRYVDKMLAPRIEPHMANHRAMYYPKQILYYIILSICYLITHMEPHICRTIIANAAKHIRYLLAPQISDEHSRTLNNNNERQCPSQTGRAMFWQSYSRLPYIAPYFWYTRGAINKVESPEHSRVLHNPSRQVWRRKPTLNKGRPYC